MPVDATLKEISCDEEGGQVIFATDDFFAVAENLIKRDDPVSNDEYTEFGKWMDGWETRRKRLVGHDWVVIAFDKPSYIEEVYVDTQYFTGNYAPNFSLQGCALNKLKRSERIPSFIELDNQLPGIVQDRTNKLGTAATVEDLERIENFCTDDWDIIVPMRKLEGNSLLHKKIASKGEAYTHVRLNIYPDGGISRLRIYGKVADVKVSAPELPRQPIGGTCVKFSDAHYGHPDNLLKSGPSKGMFDGWETARHPNRPKEIEIDGKGYVKDDHVEWAVLKLDKKILVNWIEVDTTHFKGNCPDSMRIEGAVQKPGEKLEDELLPQTKLKPNQSNGLVTSFSRPAMIEAIDHVKITIAPDGGIARIRIYGDEL